MKQITKNIERLELAIRQGSGNAVEEIGETSFKKQIRILPTRQDRYIDVERHTKAACQSIGVCIRLEPKLTAVGVPVAELG